MDAAARAVAHHGWARNLLPDLGQTTHPQAHAHTHRHKQSRSTAPILQPALQPARSLTLLRPCVRVLFLWLQCQLAWRSEEMGGRVNIDNKVGHVLPIVFVKWEDPSWV